MADETTAPAAPAADYGDDFIPTGDDANPAAPRVDDSGLAARLEAEAAASKETKPEVIPDPKKDEVIPDSKAADSKAADSKADEAGRLIPKHRFDTKNRLLKLQEDENRRLKLENEALKAAGEKPVPGAAPVLDLDAQLDVLDEKIMAARKDGDVPAERAAMAESRKLMREHYAAEVAEASSAASNVAVESMMLDGVIDDLEVAYPFLNPKSKDFDKDKADNLVELWEALELKGYRRTSALLKATSIMFPDTEDAAAEDAAAAVVVPAKREVDVKKNVAAAAKTPPDLENAGALPSDAAGIKDEIKPSRLSEKDFEALPESVKARLRGDVF